MALDKLLAWTIAIVLGSIFMGLVLILLAAAWAFLSGLAFFGLLAFIVWIAAAVYAAARADATARDY